MVMKVKIKADGSDNPNEKDMGVAQYPWEGAMQAIAAGAAEAYRPDGEERGPDQPGAQSPAPGTDPVGGKERAADGDVLTNIGKPVELGVVSTGLPKPSDADVVSTEAAPAKPLAPAPQPAPVPAKPPTR